MGAIAKETGFFSDICTLRCGGLCCDPWWGIISYQAVKKGGLSGLNSFKAELAKGIRQRAKRIIAAYVTKEPLPRSLFNEPEIYNVKVQDIRAEGPDIRLELIAMFAFRCGFLSAEKTCLLHPSAFSGGQGAADIRPDRCGRLGNPDARHGEEGFCRIIQAASIHEEQELEKALALEKEASARHLGKGFKDADEAAEHVIKELREWCESNARHLSPETRLAQANRNDPCPCKSGKKYKKCHGM